jgi:hypothetical protein
MGMRTRK